jgi:hypothetical protein
MKTTRKINGAKVTRLDGKFREEAKASSALDKIKSLIRNSAKEIAKYKFVSVRDTHPGHGMKTLGNMTGGSLLPPGKQKPSSLCAKLTSLRKKKVKVVDFYRDGAHWQIKVMA